MYVVLRNRNYALLWIGALISSIGDWALRGALPFYVYTRTGSALATGLMFIATALPWVILSSVAGVFVDHWDLKRTMIVADLARAGLMGLLLLIIIVPGLFWLVYFVSFMEACITQFFNPASMALGPRIVGKDQLQEANALGSLNGSITRLVGPLLGGVLLAMLGPASAIIADGLSYVGSAIMISLVLVSAVPREEILQPGRSEAVGKWTSCWHDWLEGLRVVKEERLLRVLFLVVALAAIGDGISSPAFVLFPSVVLHLGASAYGSMLTALGVGNLIGSLLTGRLAKRMSPINFIAAGLLGEGLTYLLAFRSQSFALSLVMFVISGTPVVGWQVSAQTLLQTTVEERLRGRVFGAYVAILSLLLLIGTALGSVLVAPLGAMSVLTLECCIMLLAGVVAFVFMRSPLAVRQQPLMGDESGEQHMIQE